MLTITLTLTITMAKIKKALGVERMPVDAREGLKRTLESFR